MLPEKEESANADPSSSWFLKLFDILYLDLGVWLLLARFESLTRKSISDDEGSESNSDEEISELSPYRLSGFY